MDEMNRKLVELNHALLKLTTENQKPAQDLLDTAVQVLSGGNRSLAIDTGPGNDIVIVNTTPCDDTCEPECPPGPPGPPGSCKCIARVISDDYTVVESDYYIGVNSDEPVTITLPADFGECKEIIVKAEMPPPLGNRKITLISELPGEIDGDDRYVIAVGYDSVRLMFRDGNWYTI